MAEPKQAPDTTAKALRFADEVIQVFRKLTGTDVDQANRKHLWSLAVNIVVLSRQYPEAK